ncbi:magnesium transporter [Mordavella massiliensis]|jgi:magnesium transporter|nr:magnesium transporter [Mordavella massiliensis]
MSENDSKMREKLTEERILEMLERKQYKELKEELENNMYPVDLADILEEFDQKHMVMVFRLLAKEEAAETFTYMNSDMREILIGALTDSELEEVMEEMYLDDTVDVLEEMPANVVDRLLLATDEEKRTQINQLLQYPEDSAGSVMNVDYIAVRKEMTVAEAILKIRQVGLNKETIYTCYVTEKRKLIGYVDVKELLTTSESKLIEEIMETNLLYAHTTDDQEDVVRMITKYGLIALPILDHENCMVGIVTVDDAMDVMQEETTEDISIMAGVAPNEDSYFETTVLEHVKSRLPWLLFLMLSATITQMIMNSYESALAVMPQLAGFIPMLTGTGGNCGSQSSTLVIRGLAVEEIEFADLPKVIWKEVRVAVCISLVLAVVNGIRILIMGQGDVMVALTIGLTMACTVVIAKVVGCTLPLCAKKVGLDPAIMATPLISTLVDISTISVYFAIVSKAFQL